MNKVVEENESQGNTSNSDNVNENGKRMKRNRLTKKQQFKKEREEVTSIEQKDSNYIKKRELISIRTTK